MRQVRILAALVSAGLLATISSPAMAVVDSGSASGGAFGMVDQNTPGITNGNVACATTATYNSFVYLNNANPGAGLGPLLGTGSISAINELSGDVPGGIPASGGVALQAGKRQYIHDKGLDGLVHVERFGDDSPLPVNDVAKWIADQLNAGQDVEMGFLWTDSNGNSVGNGHVVTITGIDYDEAGMNGTMNFIDPWNGVAITSNSLHPGTNGSLVFGYTGGGAGPGGADGQDPDNPTDAGFGSVAFAVAESLPEPSSVLGVLMVGGMALRRRMA